MQAIIYTTCEDFPIIKITDEDEAMLERRVQSLLMNGIRQGISETEDEPAHTLIIPPSQITRVEIYE